MWAEASLFFLFGCLFGSFSNVVIARLPVGKSVVTPRSSCPKCGQSIAWFDNIPVISWLLLRFKCRGCKALISARYPAVELLTGLLWAGVFLMYGWQWVTLEYIIFVWALVVVSFIDLDHMILPDVFTLSGIVLGIVGSLLNPERSVASAVGGMLMGGGFLWAIAALYFWLRKEEGMGGGDIKLLAWIGAVLGWTSIPFVIMVSSIVGSLVGIGYAAKTRAGLKSVIPFGPFLAAAAVLYLFGGEALSLWYIGLFQLPFGPVN
jgi:leader peptidase (prepilin peptidase) / N-methyltransferase